MNRDEAMGKILRMLSSDKLEEVLREHEAVVVAAPVRATRARRARPSSGNHAPRSVTKRAAALDSLLLEFTPESAYAFVYEHTVPPATEDGLALIEAYPELAAAAPELVADMALAFRHKAREEYAAHFARVALHHRLEAAP